MTAKTDPKRRPGRPPSPNSMPSKVEARVSLEQKATWGVIDGPNWLRKALDAERRKLDKARAPSTVRMTQADQNRCQKTTVLRREGVTR